MKKPLKTLVTGLTALLAVLTSVSFAADVGKVGTMAYKWSGLTDLQGNPHNLTDYLGKAVLMMTVQYNCGGCKANAPYIGAIAKKYESPKFQSLGVDVNTGTVAQLGSFYLLLKPKSDSVNFPLLRGVKPPDLIVDAQNQHRWSEYDALRDTYFIIDHTGKIVYRLNGDQKGSVGQAKYAALDSAIAAALSNVPTATFPSRFPATAKRQPGMTFDLNSGRVIIGSESKVESGTLPSIRILNIQGQVLGFEKE